MTATDLLALSDDLLARLDAASDPTVCGPDAADLDEAYEENAAKRPAWYRAEVRAGFLPAGIRMLQLDPRFAGLVLHPQASDPHRSQESRRFHAHCRRYVSPHRRCPYLPPAPGIPR